MTSLPFDVHEVLEQEYVALHGDLGDMPGPEYRAEDILETGVWVESILKSCGIAGAPLDALNALVNPGTEIAKLEHSPQISRNGQELLALYLKGDVERTPAVRRRITDEAFPGAVKSLRDRRLAALYAKLHAKDDADARAAFCISGGGIRSATFALGIIQGLAGARILDKFHYLSTVSGGGYIGSWLSSWVRRHPEGIQGVQEELNAAPKSKIGPEPRPLRHLRDYSNYLSPKLGFLSADTWTMAALYIRNVLLNLLVLVPVLAALLALPRLYENLLQSNQDTIKLSTLGLITVLALAAGFAYIGLARPVRHGRESTTAAINTNLWFALLCILPLTVAGFGISFVWVELVKKRITLQDVIPYALWGGAAMALLPCVIYYVRYSRASFAERRQSATNSGGAAFAWKLVTEGFAAFVGLATAGGLLVLLALKVFPDPLRAVPNANYYPPITRLLVPLPLAELYACFSVPLILIVFFVQASIFVGLSSLFNEDNDREWWGRAGALLLMVAILGGGASFIAVFGPVLLYQAPMFFGAVGAGTGGGAALLGYSARTPAQGKKREKGDKSGAVTGALLNFAGPIFAVVLLAAISLGTSELLRLIDFKHTNTAAAERAEARRKVDAQFLATVSKEETHRTYHLKSEIKDVPLQSMAAQRAWFHLSGIQGTDRTELAFIFGLAAGAVFLSLFIGVNRFSMHGLYRNRLIRAYLGASRYNRDPDRFTGFDENDNLQMYELRPQLLWPNSFTDACEFVDQVSKPAGDVERRIWDALGDKIQNRIKDVKDKKYPGTLISAVTQRVNVLMQTIDLATGKPDGNPVKLLDANRKLLEKTFKTLKPLGVARPMHVVNAALNLVSGDNLAWQQRMAESFTVSPLHCGSLYLGYRDAREYGGPDGISLGTAVTISGAAASPNMGYHSSVPLAFILTLLNVRLGAWLGNPGAAGEGSYKKGSPNGNLVPLGYELTGNTNDRCPWVYLSDGGHFENLALYEMVLRRCRYIVVSDGGCDPTFTYEDLGNAIRKIRIDLGVPIEIDSREMFPRPKPGEPLRSGSYIATATIKYSAVDDGGKDGLLIYLKPSVYKEGSLPRDVYNYAQQSPDFPHESTSDQFFSESQFESYRALGRHVFDVICRNGKPQPSTGDLPAFAKAMLPIKKQDDVVGSMEVTTTNGEISVAHGVADGVQIRIRQTNA